MVASQEAADTGEEAAAKARAALLGAVPLTRMIDTGMDVGSALRLVAAVGAGASFDEVAVAEADALLVAASAVAPGLQHLVRRAAIGALVVAQLAFNGDSERKRELYARITAEVDGLAAIGGGHYRPVQIPFEGSRLYGLLVSPGGDPTPPTVILFGGLNGWGVAYLGVAEALSSAGLACLLVELPGQGNTRALGGLTGGTSTVRAVSTCIDWVEADSSLGDRVGVWGNSFGGLFAALAAAQDTRIAAACINGAPATPTVPPFRTARELMFPFFGVESVDELAEALETVVFADSGLTIDCPLLVLHGDMDPLANADDQRGFFDAATGQRMWREWADGQHTIYNHVTERNAVAANWFAAALG